MSAWPHGHTSLHLQIGYMQPKSWNFTKVSYKLHQDSPEWKAKENSPSLHAHTFKTEMKTKILTLLLRESESGVSLSMVVFEVLQTGTSCFQLQMLLLQQLSTQKPTGMLKRKARKCLIKYMINTCASRLCLRLGQSFLNNSWCLCLRQQKYTWETFPQKLLLNIS